MPENTFRFMSGFVKQPPENLGPWPDIVGRLILNFGTIEMLTNLLILQFSSDALLAEEVLSLNLSRRVPILRSLIKRAELEDTSKQRVLSAIDFVAGAIELRNTVAHNALLIGWTQPEHSGPPDFMGLPKIHSKSSRRTGVAPIASLVKLNETVARLHAAAADLASVVTLRPEFSLLVPDEK